MNSSGALFDTAPAERMVQKDEAGFRFAVQGRYKSESLDGTNNKTQAGLWAPEESDNTYR